MLHFPVELTFLLSREAYAQDRTGLEKDGRSQASESVGHGWVLSFLAPWLLSWSSGPLWIYQKTKIAFVSLWEKEIRLPEAYCFRVVALSQHLSLSCLQVSPVGFRHQKWENSYVSFQCSWKSTGQLEPPSQTLRAGLLPHCLSLTASSSFCTQRLQSTSQTVHCAAPPWLNKPIGSNISSSA